MGAGKLPQACFWTLDKLPDRLCPSQGHANGTIFESPCLVVPQFSRNDPIKCGSSRQEESGQTLSPGFARTKLSDRVGMLVG